MNRSPRVVVVGSGMSGLCAVHYLREAGVTDITVLEKRDAVGGTWRDNTYPGLACDVPSRFYQFTFAPNPDWSHVFSPGAEIAAYFEKVADDLGMRRFVHHGQEVTSIDRVDGEWLVHTAAGDTWHADFVLSAAGVLHHPHVPEIPGAEDFGGAIFHSARWDHDVPLEGARVGIIGSGSTGVRTVDGVEHELDVLVLATGFDAHAFIRPAAVVGDGGRTLDDAWADGPKAYYGVAVPGLANLFMLMGPHSPVGNYSLTCIAESQAEFVAGWIARWAQGEFDTVEVTEEAYRAHQEAMNEAMPGTVWASGCTSWYLGKDGLPELWPWTPDRYRRAMRAPVEEHWRLDAAPDPSASPRTPGRRRRDAAPA